MSGDRLQRLQENQLETRVSNLRQQIASFKEAQITGASSILVKKNQTANPVDLTQSLTGTFPQTVAEIHIAFTPAKKGDAYAELNVKAYRDSESNVMGVTIYDDPTTATDTTKTGWVIYVDAFDTIVNDDHDYVNAAHTYYFKFFVNSVDTGTISWYVVVS